MNAGTCEPGHVQALCNPLDRRRTDGTDHRLRADKLSSTAVRVRKAGTHVRLAAEGTSSSPTVTPGEDRQVQQDTPGHLDGHRARLIT